MYLQEFIEIRAALFLKRLGVDVRISLNSYKLLIVRGGDESRGPRIEVCDTYMVSKSFLDTGHQL